jgi:hypothetical protein
LISLELYNPAVTCEGIVYQNPNLAGGDVREGKLPPYVSIAGYITARNIRKKRPGPILHLQICNTVLSKQHARGGGYWTAVVIL